MQTKSGVIIQKENKLELPEKTKVVEKNQVLAVVGDRVKCPECGTLARVVWISQDQKTMGVQCPASHRAMNKVWSNHGETLVPSSKARKNVVFLTSIK
jgi:DNA-directed RNA polymerase subunit RPC12/RpoP